VLRHRAGGERGPPDRAARPQPPAESLLDLSEYAVKGDDEYEQARQTAEQAALNAVAARDRELLQELLLGFDRCYQAASDRESALDYDDLQLRARDLLRDDESIREREQLRFRQVCVDEFQDTNRLQCELIDLVARDELFFVGDEFQSIYRFLHADVEVFKERRDQIGEVLPLTQLALAPGDPRGRQPPVRGHVRRRIPAARRGRSLPRSRVRARRRAARHRQGELQGRAAQLASGGGQGGRAPRQGARRVRRGRARRDRRPLRSGDRRGAVRGGAARGRPSDLSRHRAWYFGQRQVRDLLGHLRLLHNRYDDEALVTVLASPFVGVSNDALALLRRAAPRRPLYTGLEKAPGRPGRADRQLLQAFRQRYDRLTAVAGNVGLERLCEQVLVEHDYDLAVLARWDGRRRYANLRKLARLARSYEELRGPDIEGFVRFVLEQDAAGVKELEAVAEE
jgi:ATP-dependent exoDNAse (exonuclease V) beta subunit